ncbi:MAG: MotA/TolQ/ExbB proton channel family protein [Planctomycetes bacterium]|nr:MotA/TolQ/ExbB proton channel family protein [Planctomycetota bacterium]
MSKKYLWTTVSLTLFSIAFFALPGLAQEGEAPAPSFFDSYVTSGGLIGYVIILIDVVMWGLVINYFIQLRRDKLVPPMLVEELERLFEDEAFEEALEICEVGTNALERIMSSALPKLPYGFETVDESFKAALDGESVKMAQQVSYLNLIGAIAPMLGLFGTVTGMIGAFNTIASKPSVNARELAGDIGVALGTTCQGLFVAIPAVCMAFYFQNRVIRLTNEIGAICEDFFVRFRPEAE